MSPYILIITLVSGAAIAIQAQFTGSMDRAMGTVESVFITYVGGGLLVAIIMAILRGGNLGNWRQLSPYVFLAGALGLVIIGTIAFSVNRVGLTRALVLITTSQYLFGAFMSHYGFLGADVKPIDLGRVAGLMLMIGGTYLVVR